MNSWQLRSVFSITSCLNLPASIDIRANLSSPASIVPQKFHLSLKSNFGISAQAQTAAAISQINAA